MPKPSIQSTYKKIQKFDYNLHVSRIKCVAWTGLGLYTFIRLKFKIIRGREVMWFQPY